MIAVGIGFVFCGMMTGGSGGGGMCCEFVWYDCYGYYDRRILVRLQSSVVEVGVRSPNECHFPT